MPGSPAPSWVTAVEADAPDVVACRRAADASLSGAPALRRELAARVTEGSAPRMLQQEEAVGNALEAFMRDLPEALLRVPGGEEDWNVAQAFAHTTAARRFLAVWAALDAGGRPGRSDSPRIVPSVPGRADATREELLILLDKSRRAIREAAARIEGHERQHCALEHPSVGHLRCGEWLLFIGIHDLMHLEQLHRLAADDA